MPQVFDAAPIFQLDDEGRIVRSHGADVPQGLVHCVVPLDATVSTSVQLETAIGGLYDYARQLRGDGRGTA